MTNREIEQKLKQEVEATVPDVLASVMARCDQKKGQVIPMPKKKNIFMKVAAIAASLALILGLGLFAFSYFGSNDVASIVTLDVNPSIELQLDKNARVLQANALNEDAAVVLEGMDLKNTDLTTATNAIIGSLLKHGYLDQLANAILISVEDEDSARGARLQKDLSRDVDQLLTAASMNANVLSQYVSADVNAVSNEHHISHGKAALIEQLLAVNPGYRFEELAALSVQELSLLMENPKNRLENVSTTGTTDASAYIGKDKAKAIALEDAGLTEAEVYDLDVDFDYEQGVLVYEVDFELGSVEYDYDIDATSGRILRSHVEDDNAGKAPDANTGNTPDANTGNDNSTPAPEDIGETKAKSIALEHAGVTEAQVTGLYAYKEYDDGIWEYHVEFYLGYTEYEYEISALDGAILDFDKDTHDDHDDHHEDSHHNSPSTEAPVAEITEAEAKAIALSHAGFTEADVSGLRVERDYDDGRAEYKVEFRVGNTEYEYEILAADGSILDFEKDHED